MLGGYAAVVVEKVRGILREAPHVYSCGVTAMAFKFTPGNLYLMKRVEGASAYEPIASGTYEEFVALLRSVRECATWAEVPASTRAIVEQAEANRAEIEHKNKFVGDL